MPVPESYLAAIVAGMLLHRFRPAKLFARPRVGRVVGGSTLLAGSLVVAWAVSAAGRVEISDPNRVVAEGPYAVTRNPMYLAWSLIGAGFALVANNAWALLLLPLAVAFTHLIEIPREERYLERRFGDAYLRYRARVPRWV